MNALDRSSTLIAMKPFRFAGRKYSPGDNFKYNRMGHAQLRKVKRLIEGPERKIAELTQATMEKALRRRDNPRPPRNFTLAGLVGLNVLTMDQIKDYGWDREDLDLEQEDVEAWSPPEGSWSVITDGAEKGDPDTLWVVPFKTGGATRYHVVNANGEKLNGEASIGGKVNADKWAKDYLVEQAKQRKLNPDGGDGGEPDWTGFAEDPSDWTDDQVETFVTWFDGLDDDAKFDLSNPGVAKAFHERGAVRHQERLANHEIFGMTAAEARDFLEGLSEDDLRQFVAAQQGKPVEDLADLSPVALLDLAAEIHADKTGQEQDDDSNLQPGADQPAG